MVYTDIDFVGILTQILFGAPMTLEVVNNLAIVRTIKFLLLVYVVILFIDIVILLSLRGVGRDLKMNLVGSDFRPLRFGKSKGEGFFRKITNRLESGNVSQYKAAILEADALADKILTSSRYTGNNMGERLANIPAGHIETLPLLLEAHTVRNRIVNDAAFEIDRSETERVIGLYKSFFEEMELI